MVHATLSGEDVVVSVTFSGEAGTVERKHERKKNVKMMME